MPKAYKQLFIPKYLDFGMMNFELIAEGSIFNTN